MNLSLLNITNYVPYDQIGEFVKVESCKAWCHNSIVYLDYAPMIWSLVLITAYIFFYENKKFHSYFPILLIMFVVHTIVMLVFKRI